ncbi:prepilin-type N-terminal cleavage/methylation domain-containing protein [Patescibacteria group bacterium]
MFSKKGFTLIELLIVIAIIAILAAVAFVALDPLTRFQDARDSRRWSDVAAIMSAIKVDQVDNGGSYLWGINNAADGATTVADDEYMISNATTTSGCNASACSVISATNDCVNLQGLADEGYLGSLPISPNGDGSWTEALSGYYMILNSNGSITIGACEAENTASITVTR